MQGDGNLVLYQQANGVLQRALWSSGTYGHTGQGVYAYMQPDGNLVIYTPSSGSLWNSGTSGHNGARLAVQGDGNIIVYSTTNQALWSPLSTNDMLTPGTTLPVSST